MGEEVKKIPLNDYKLYKVGEEQGEEDLNEQTDDATPIGAASAVTEYGAVAKLYKMIAMDIMGWEDTSVEKCELVVKGPFPVYSEVEQWDVVAYALQSKAGEEAEVLHVSEYRLIKDQ